MGSSDREEGPGGVAVMQVSERVYEVVVEDPKEAFEKMKRWLVEGRGIRVFRNHDLGSANVGGYAYVPARDELGGETPAPNWRYLPEEGGVIELTLMQMGFDQERREEAAEHLLKRRFRFFKLGPADPTDRWNIRSGDSNESFYIETDVRIEGSLENVDSVIEYLKENILSDEGRKNLETGKITVDGDSDVVVLEWDPSDGEDPDLDLCHIVAERVYEHGPATLWNPE